MSTLSFVPFIIFETSTTPTTIREQFLFCLGSFSHLYLHAEFFELRKGRPLINQNSLNKRLPFCSLF